MHDCTFWVVKTEMEKGILSLDAKKSSKYSKYSNKNCSIKKPKFHENLTLTYITKKVNNILRKRSSTEYSFKFIKNI